METVIPKEDMFIFVIGSSMYDMLGPYFDGRLNDMEPKSTFVLCIIISSQNQNRVEGITEPKRNCQEKRRVNEEHTSPRLLESVTIKTLVQSKVTVALASRE